jgi:phosphate-selective porin OprO/OprP
MTAIAIDPKTKPAKASLGLSMLAALTAAVLSPADSAWAAPPHLAFETEGGIEVSVPWYLQWQWLRADDDRTPIEDRFGFRRARMAIEIERAGSWDFKAEYDWEASQWADVAYGHVFGAGKLRLGHYRMPLGLEQGASNRDAVLLERGLPNALTYARRLGVGYEWVGAATTVRAAVFGRNLSRTEDANGAAVRVTYAPWRTEERVIHLGLTLGTEDIDGGEERFSSRPDIGLAQLRVVDTGRILDVDSTDRIGLEGAWIKGPWSVQGEYIRARVDDGRRSGTGNGWYVLGAWTITGESRVYRDGLIRTPKPSGPWGAVELAARIGQLDLDGGLLNGGEVDTVTFGANWYVGPALRISANIVDVESTRRGLDDDPRVFEFRVQTQF